MAEFSKQWCEINDPQMPWDFDILEIASNLDKEYYSPQICEGFGFLAIGKNADGDIILAFENEDETVSWKSYNEVIK
jgi:hypothetical protein